MESPRKFVCSTQITFENYKWLQNYCENSCPEPEGIMCSKLRMILINLCASPYVQSPRHLGSTKPDCGKGEKLSRREGQRYHGGGVFLSEPFPKISPHFQARIVGDPGAYTLSAKSSLYLLMRQSPGV